MKRVEVTAPSKQKKQLKEVLDEYDNDLTIDEVEKDDRSFTQITLTVDSDVIDELAEKVKDIKKIDSGDLTIDILEETVQIEKGKRREGGSSSLSVQEMYSKAFEFASFGYETWALIALGAGIAVFGAWMENIMVVVGSMVITPLLGPFISISFGLVIGDRKLIEDSLFAGVLSMLLAISTAFLISLLLPIRVNSVILLIADSGFATIPLSLFVGAAAALTFTTENREALAGVAVAIALVPPAAVVGIALSQLNVALLLDVSLVLISNVMSLILAGSITFKLVGVTPSTYYRKKISEKELRRAVTLSLSAIVIIALIVGYLSYIDLQSSTARAEVEQYIGETVTEPIVKQTVDVGPGTVTVELVVVDPAITSDQLETGIEQRVGREANVQLVALAGMVKTQ